MPPRKSNGVVGAEDARRVLVDREEHAALLALKEADELRVVDDAKVSNRVHDLVVTCGAQARRLAEVDLVVQHQERVNGLQRVLLDTLRSDHPRLASVEDLSEFWKQWTIATGALVERQPQQREAVAKLEPDLFRSWSLWVRDSGRASRSFSAAGTRAEVDAARPATQGELQVRIADQQRAAIAALAARVRELEGEVEACKLTRPKDKKS